MATFFTALTSIVLPIALVASAAYGLARSRTVLDTRALARLSLYLFSPALVLRSLSQTQLVAAELLSIAAFAVLVLLVMAVVSLLLARLLSFDRMLTSAFLLSILFVNAGNYGLPFNQFAFGEEGISRATVYYIVNSIMAQTLAVYIASSGHSSVRESITAIFRLPLIYAAAAGMALNFFQIQMPTWLSSAVSLAADAALPLMLANLGIELARARLQDYDWKVLLAAGIKLFVTPLVALALAALLGLQGLTRSVSVIEASMPTAVMASIIAIEFQARPEFVTSVIFISTLGSTVTLVLLLLFMGYTP